MDEIPPRLYQYPAIIAFLGYYPFDHETETLGGKIRRCKFEYGLSNEKLAKELDINTGTVVKWEQTKRIPLSQNMEKVLLVLNINAAD